MLNFVTFIWKHKVKLLIVIIVIILLLLLLSLVHFDYLKYVSVDNYSDLVQYVNSDVVDVVDVPFDNEEDESVYVKNLSESFIQGYKVFDSPFMELTYQVSNLSDVEKLMLTYYFMTSGKGSVCFKKDFFHEMFQKYFGTDMKLEFRDKRNFYDFFRGRYCINGEMLTNHTFSLADYTKNGNVISLTYYENDVDNSAIYEWNISFLRESNGYYLNSFSNIVVETY